MTDLTKQALEAKPDAQRLPPSSKEYRYPLRAGNQFEFLVDGEVFFPRIFADIRNAKRYVFVEMYLCASGSIFSQFMDAILAARKNNAEVYLLLDDYGTKKINDTDLEALHNAGVHITFYNPLRWFRFKHNLHRTHRKIYIIDGEIAYTGGAGLADEFGDGGTPSKYWHDVMVRIVGACVDDWLNIFARTWRSWAKKTPLPDLHPAPAHISNLCGRVVYNRGASDSEIRHSLVRHIFTAKERLWLAVPYFVPARKFRAKLRASSTRGVDTRLLLPGPITDNAASRYIARRYYKKLLKCGVKIYEYQPRFLHAKIFLVDSWCSIGSSNLDRWNMAWNLDANQEIHNPEFTEKVATQFVQDFAQSKTFDLESWHKRPLYERFVEKFWGFIMYLLTRFSRGAERHRII